MKKIIFLLSCIILILILAVFYLRENKSGEICFENDCYFVEIVESAGEREKGLMYRDNLEADKGMFFIFEEEGIYPFWMKNMKFPIDIIWLNKDYRIIFIAKSALPCVEKCDNIVPDKPAKYVLEINAGEASKNEFKVGDILTFGNKAKKYEFFTKIRK